MIIKPKKFVGLHAHDGFSSFDGMGLPGEHFDFVRANMQEEGGTPALAITNHGNMNSYAHAYLYSKELNKSGKTFKFIPGCEVYMHPDLEGWRDDYKRFKEKGEAEKLAKKNAKKAKDLAETIDDAMFEAQTGIKLEKADDEASSGVENEEETKSNKFRDPVKRRHHLVVLAKHSKGLEHLFHTVSRGFMEGYYYYPRVDLKMLKQYQGDFVVSTACIGGPLAYDVFGNFPNAEFDDLKPTLVDDPLVMQKVLRDLENTTDRLVDAVGRDNFFLELQFNKLNAQHLVNRCLIELHKKTGIPLIATADSHYCKPEVWKEREIYKKLGWLRNSADASTLPQSIDDLKTILFPKNASQMWDEYKKTGEGMEFYDDQLVCDAIERTHDIAFSMIEDVTPDSKVKLPSYVIPEKKTAAEALRDISFEGLTKMGFANRKKYVERLEFELAIIIERNFCEYFLTMKAIIDLAADHMLVGCGRGSGAGSLVNYVLGITQVDPIKYGLIFERFISKYRTEMPDIDTDVGNRNILNDLLKKTFGDANVIPISNYNTFQLKSLVKDVAKFYGIEYMEANEATKTLDEDVKSAVFKVGEDKNLFQLKYDDALAYCKPFRDFIEKYPQVGAPIKTLFKENKSLGRHAGGVIVSERVPERMPLIFSKKALQTPWVEGMHYKHLEHLGWIKFDLLGLETLRIIQRCIELILERHENIPKPAFKEVKKWYDKNLHPDKLDLDDQKVYKNVYHDGSFAGIFQFTARGAQQFIKKVKPTSILEIATATSIYRPGPLAANVHETYIHAKANPDSVSYDHPLIKEVLEKTFGHIIFQEQLMQCGHVIGGLDLNDCDKLRKAITKRSMSGASKAKEEALRLEALFIEGAQQRGVKKEIAQDLFDKLEFFSGYGFNASHAVSYAIDSYMCAYLMTYYEAEWLCAYMETQASNPYKRAKAIGELMAQGYEIVRVDINKATEKWTIIDKDEDGKPLKQFMPSFLTVKGVGEVAVNEIYLNRPYKSLNDLLWKESGDWKHSKFNKRSLQNLIKIRAFDSMGIVGPGKLFTSYQQMHSVLIGEEEYSSDKKKLVIVRDNTKLLKNKKKGRDNLELLLTEYSIPTERGDFSVEWTKEKLLEMSKELVGSYDLNLLISTELRKVLHSKGFNCVDELVKPKSNDEEDDVEDLDDAIEDESVKAKGHWFIVEEVTHKKTKSGKPYVLLSVFGEAGSVYKLYVWNWNEERWGFAPLKRYKTYLVQDVETTEFGLSVKMKDIRPVVDKWLNASA